MKVRHVAALFTLSATLSISVPAAAHCDTLKGPVITAARAALEAGDANLVLHWVRPDDETAVRSAFDKTIAVRGLGPQAKGLADRYFFETLVRIHRAGEGAAYTGLIDGEPEPIIAATDRALESGSTEELEQQLVAAVRGGLADRFAAARATKGFRPGDVAGGRAFVAAYVPLTHWVEGVFTAATASIDHHATGEHAARASAEGHAAHGAGELDHLHWILTGLFAVAAVVEGGFLIRRRLSPPGRAASRTA